MVMVNDKVGSFRVVQSAITGNADTDLNNLTAQYPDDGMAMFWDLNASIEPILNELPKYALTALKEKGKCIWREWDLFYIPGKILSVCYNGGRNYLYYNLSQYFPMDDDVTKDDYDKWMFDYADMPQRLADELEHALHIMGIWPKKLSSPAAIFEDFYGKHLNLPTFKDFMPKHEKLLEYAAECAGNEWQEVFKIGQFKECYSYDRKSAYGTEMVKLLDNNPRYMSIVESDKYIPEADYAYCKCDIEIKDNVTLHPIINISHDRSLSCKTGEWTGYLTKGQMDFIKRWQIGDYEIVNGYWLTSKSRVKPLEFFIPRILQFKEHPNNLVRFLAKNMVNGFAGKFNEEYKERVGDLYNPMWSAEIITGNALNLCEAIYRSKSFNNIIQVKVDEFKTTKKLDVIPDGYKESTGECLSIDNNNVFFGKQHPDGITYAQAIKMLTEHPNTGYYEQSGAVIDLFRLGLTRDFKTLPETGTDLLNNIYESNPFTQVI
jgi:hypothetical protein